MLHQRCPLSLRRQGSAHRGSQCVPPVRFRVLCNSQQLWKELVICCIARIDSALVVLLEALDLLYVFIESTSMLDQLSGILAGRRADA